MLADATRGKAASRGGGGRVRLSDVDTSVALPILLQKDITVF